MSNNDILPIADLVNKQHLSFIASLNQKASVLTQHGEKVIKLSGGDPPHYPEKLRSIFAEFSQNSEDSIFCYSPIAGFDRLRELLAMVILPRYRQVFSKDNILVCSGGCSGLFLTFKTLLNSGDRVLIQDPCWEYLPRLVENSGGIPVKMNFFSKPSLENNWEQLLKEIEQYLQSGIRVVSINSPLNPSGTIVPYAIKNNIIQLCKKYNAWFVSDDVTIDFNYIESDSATIDNADNFISVNSFSKNLGITGLRFGFVAGCERFINQLKKSQLYTFMYPNSVIQKLIERYLSHDVSEYYDYISSISHLYKTRANEYADIFSTIPELEVLRPEGGLFLFPKLKTGYQLDFEKLIEQHHLVVAPGEAFSAECKEYFRVFLGVEKDVIVKASQIIKNFLQC